MERRVDGGDVELVDVMVPLLYCRQRGVQRRRVVE
jgi:hypothetical protein